MATWRGGRGEGGNSEGVSKENAQQRFPVAAFSSGGGVGRQARHAREKLAKQDRNELFCIDCQIFPLSLDLHPMQAGNGQHLGTEFQNIHQIIEHHA